MKKVKGKTVITMRDYDFARVMNSGNYEDITEWFSDHDVHISDVIRRHSENTG